MTRHMLMLLFTALLFACVSNKSDEQDKPVVTVSILPQKTFIEKIAGDDFEVQVLVPHGASPESYSLLPSQLKITSRSEVWFRLGYLGFELSWRDKIKEINQKIQVIDLSEGLDLIVEEEVQHGDHVHHKGVDPHFWMSPVRVRQMAKKTTEILSALIPEKSSEYQVNYEKFAAEIDELDQKIRTALKDYQGRSFITFHPSLAYFARDYGLIQQSLEFEGKDPTPQQMAKIVELAQKENIRVIYIQSEFDKDHARVFAEEINGKILEIKPLSPDWLENIFEMTTQFIENF